MRLDCGCRKGLNFNDVFIKPKRSSLGSRDFIVNREFTFPHSKRKWSGVPIIASNMDHTGTFDMLWALNKFDCMTALHKHQPNVETLKSIVSQNLHYNMWYSIGIGNDELARLEQFVEAIFSENSCFYPNICIDVANGYSQYFSDFVKKVREKFPSSIILAGNVATHEMTEQLILSGADIVKIGIGPGSVCTTRKVTGVGYPQLSAIDECADAAHGLGGMVCADGGCVVPGDVAKAFCAGADFVMLGGMLAGHDECSGNYILEDGSEISFKGFGWEVGNEFQLPIVGMKFYGMSSREAQETYYGGVKDYRAPEGKGVIVPYRGPVENTIKEILGGIRSTMTYVGARRLKDLPKCATFVRTTMQTNECFT